MSNSNSNPVYTPPPTYGTGMVDRTNVVILIRRYLKMFWRRWWIVALCVIVGTFVMAYRANHTPDIFMATAKLGLKPSFDTGLDTKGKVREDGYTYAENQIAYMKSQPVRQRVAQALKDYPFKTPERPNVIAVPRRGQGSTFELSVESSDFDYAMNYVKVWANEFLKFKAELKGGVVTNKGEHSLRQKQSFEEKLIKVRADLDNFTKTNNIVGSKDIEAAQDQYDKLSRQFDDMVTQRRRWESATKEEIAREITVDKPKLPEKKAEDVKSNPPAESDQADPSDKFASGSRYTSLALELRRKEAELARNRKTLKEGHPRMKELRGEIEQLKQEIKDQLDLIEEQRLARIGSMKKEEAPFAKLIEEKKQELLKLHNIQRVYSQLKEDEVNIKVNLNRLAQELQSIELASANEEEIYRVEEAVGVPIPTGPNRPKIVLTGVLGGLVFGIAIIFFLQRLDDRLDLAEEIEGELQEPVLGQLPLVEKKSIKHGRLLVTDLEEHNMYSEAIRGVRSAVMFSGQGTNKQVIMVTSAVPGDGKTSFTVNFAAILAKAGNRVLLVDADLRRGNTCNYFSHPHEPGFTEMLAGEEHWTDVMHDTSIKTLSVINSGRLPSNPGELLLSPVARQFIEEARQEFHHIIIDCPPLTAIDDTFSLLGLVDGVLFVVRAGQTSLRFAKTGLAAMRQRGTQIIGLVLNGLTSDNPSYYYARRYHAYYSKNQATLPTTYSVPAAKMAVPKKARFQIHSIEAEAKLRAGQNASLESIAAEEHHKAEVFKARRTAQQQSAD